MPLAIKRVEILNQWSTQALYSFEWGPAMNMPQIVFFDAYRIGLSIAINIQNAFTSHGF